MVLCTMRNGYSRSRLHLLLLYDLQVLLGVSCFHRGTGGVVGAVSLRLHSEGGLSLEIFGLSTVDRNGLHEIRNTG